MSKTVALLANDTVGVEVARYLAAHGDHIACLYLHDPEYQKCGDQIIAASGCAPGQVRLASALKNPDEVAQLRTLRPDFIITVYWRHLLSKEVIGAAGQGTVNFHPALLPINRGWYPHVHSILDGSPTGVTLHALEEQADAGPIWAQREVPLGPTDTAHTIYVRLQREIVNLFKETWPQIAAGKVRPVPQDESRAVYHKINEVDAFDALDLDATMKARDVLNLLRARSFGDRGFAYFEEAGQRVYINLRLGSTSSFASES